MAEFSVQIDPEEAGIVLDILERHVPGRQIFVFGSRAKHKARRRSDLDLAVADSKPLDLQTRANLTCDFSESDLPYRVDVVDLVSVDPEFRRMIEADLIPVSAMRIPK